MKKILPVIVLIIFVFFSLLIAQTNDWMTDYALFDTAPSGNATGWQTSSVAVVGANRFVALVTAVPDTPVVDNLFNPPGNFLVGYWDADSVNGRVPAPINGESLHPAYDDANDGYFTDWSYILDKINFEGAWSIAADNVGRIYVANNDESHNILVYELTSESVVATANRMETGSEYIFGIDIDSIGNVYVVDYEGRDDKTDEVKVYAGIDADGTTWEGFGGHTDAPIATIDLPLGIYQGITANNDGTEIFVSATSERRVLKFVGDPESGFTQDDGFSFVLSEDDTVASTGTGTTSVLGMAYLDDPELVFVVADTFISKGVDEGYPYGRIYVLDPEAGTALDTIDIAQWNLEMTGVYNTGSGNGRAGGFTSVVDVDVDSDEPAVYTQSYFGWTVEKWIFDGDLYDLMTSVKQVNNQIPVNFDLKQNFPNPFNPLTTIEFNVQKAGPVSLNLYNAMGQKIMTLVEREFTPGTYQVDLDGSHLASGVYFYQLTAGKLTSVKKMTLLK